jgi:CheY-like chemotaxis protein
MPKTLLLADDSVTIQKVVGITFANEDVELVTVDNGTDGLVRTREIRPDIVMADVAMPGLNGYELCAAIKSDHELAHIPVLLLTGTFESYNREKAEEAGANGHISKPFEAQALIDQVHALLAEAPRPVAPPAPAAPSFAERPAASPGASGRSPGSADYAGPLPSADETRVLEPPLAARAAAPEAAAESDEWNTVPGTDPAEARDAFGFDDLLGDEPDTLDETGANSGFIDPLAEPEGAAEAPGARPLVPEPSEAPEGLRASATPPPARPERAAAETSEEWLSERAARPQPAPTPEPTFERRPLAMPAPTAEPPRAHAPAAPPPRERSHLPETPRRLEVREEAPPEPLERIEPPSAPTPRAPQADVTPRAEPVEHPAAPRPAEPRAAARIEEPPREPPGWQRAAHEGLARLAEPDPLLEDVEPEGEAPPPVRPERSRPGASAAPAETDWPLADEEPAVEPLATAEPELEAVSDEDLPWVEPEEAEVLEEAPVEPVPEPAARAPEPEAAVTAPPPRAAAPRIDPAAIQEELEKVAWEAFGNMSEQIVREVVRRVEQIAWEVVPQLTERLIRQEIEHLKAEDPDD